MRHQRGFTLVELLVVIGIIALLISILLPSLNRVRVAATYTKCLSNERQLIVGVLMYCADNHGYFPGGTFKATKVTTPFLSPDSEPMDIANPFSLNRDDAYGPTWLLKYVKGSEQAPLMFCPADASTTNVFTTSIPPIAGARRTSYRYSKTLYYSPFWINQAGNISASTPREIQKITSVKAPASKAIMDDAENYHEKGKPQKIDTLASQGIYVYLSIGFVDGHVERVSTKDLLDYDINYTGRNTIESTAGVKGRDRK